jgi:hypothetical protein
LEAVELDERPVALGVDLDPLEQLVRDVGLEAESVGDPDPVVGRLVPALDQPLVGERLLVVLRPGKSAGGS